MHFSNIIYIGPSTEDAPQIQLPDIKPIKYSVHYAKVDSLNTNPLTDPIQVFVIDPSFEELKDQKKLSKFVKRLEDSDCAVIFHSDLFRNQLPDIPDAYYVPKSGDLNQAIQDAIENKIFQRQDRKFTLLYVDNQDTAWLEMFSYYGIKVKTAQTPAEAQEMVLKGGIDLVVSDVLIRGVDKDDMRTFFMNTLINDVPLIAHTSTEPTYDQKRHFEDCGDFQVVLKQKGTAGLFSAVLSQVNFSEQSKPLNIEKNQKNKKPLVVYVDDSSTSRERMHSFFGISALGYNLVTFPSLEKAETFLRKNKADLIISDVLFPGKHPSKTAEKLRELNEKVCPVVLFSSAEFEQGKYGTLSGIVNTEGLTIVQKEDGCRAAIAAANTILLSLDEPGINKKTRVLLVDDDPEDVVGDNPKRFGVEITYCSGPEEAWEIYDALGNQFDIVVSDIKFSGSPEDARNLSELAFAVQDDEIPFVICSAAAFCDSDFSKIRRASRSSNLFHHLQKPLFPSAFLTFLRRLDVEYNGIGKRILVIEDNPSHNLATMKILDRAGFKFIVARDIDKARERLEKEFFDAVISDIRFASPKSTAFLLKDIFAQGIPLVFCSCAPFNPKDLPNDPELLDQVRSIPYVDKFEVERDLLDSIREASRGKTKKPVKISEKILIKLTTPMRHVAPEDIRQLDETRKLLQSNRIDDSSPPKIAVYETNPDFLTSTKECFEAVGLEVHATNQRKEFKELIEKGEIDAIFIDLFCLENVREETESVRTIIEQALEKGIPVFISKFDYFSLPNHPCLITTENFPLSEQQFKEIANLIKRKRMQKQTTLRVQEIDLQLRFSTIESSLKRPNEYSTRELNDLMDKYLRVKKQLEQLKKQGKYSQRKPPRIKSKTIG